MTATEIKNMLRTNNFNANDKAYWENELKKVEAKEMAFANNQKKILDYEKGWK